MDCCMQYFFIKPVSFGRRQSLSNPFLQRGAFMKISLIAMDAAPLLALANADELDALLMPGVRVIVPDMVRYQLIHRIEQAGAQETLDWIRLHDLRQVFVVSTEEYEECIVLRKLARISGGCRGEQAANEILAREVAHGMEGAILLSDDITARQAHWLPLLPDNVVVLSTSAYLKRLRMAPSVAAVLQRYMPASRPWN
jgi:hypothetical protein